ncbi:MAG: peptidoglycan-binding domain-containing protein [Acidobacteriota bacterium]
MSIRLTIATVACCAFAFAASDSDSVRQAQTLLKNQGYYAGNVDGISGPQTRAAVRKYQKDHNLKTTGRLDSATTTSLHAAEGTPQAGINEAKKGINEAKGTVRTDEGNTVGAKEDQGHDSVQNATKKSASEARKEVKGAADEVKGVLGGGDKNKKK